MWRDGVKSRLLDERTRWEREHSGDALEIVSVTQICRLLDGSSASLETLKRWQVDICDVSYRDASSAAANGIRDDERQVKRPRTQTHDQPKATSYTSTNVWITGFIRLERPTSSAVSYSICIGDASTSIRARLENPSMDLVDSLVLIKNWTILRTHSSHGATQELAIEVIGAPLVLDHSQPTKPTIEAVRELIRSNYTASDPPMHVGYKYWDGTTSSGSFIEDTSHKRKIHIVFGRIAAVSPIASPEDPSSTHFFVEVEAVDPPDTSTGSIVNVLVAGIDMAKFHHFLWPGLCILMTNLKKVYNPENSMFLLQASVGNSDRKRDTKIVLWSSSSTEHHTTSGSASSRKAIDIEGEVVSIVWEDCIVLHGSPMVHVSMFHFPWPHLKAILRRGAMLKIHQAHILSESSPENPRLVIGLCSRSHIRVSRHGSVDGRFVASSDFRRAQLQQKKFACFGSFPRQPLAVTMWWLGLLEVLVRKFRFGSDAAQVHDDSVSFPCIRRRDVTLVIGQDVLGGAVATSRDRSSTLAHRFLRSHSEDDDLCPSAVVPWRATSAITLHDLREHIHKMSMEILDQSSSTTVWPLKFDPAELPRVYAIGVIEGCIGSSDLALVDATASVPLVLHRSTGQASNVAIDNGCAVYVLRVFSALVEHVEAGPTSSSPLFEISLVASVFDLQRVSLCSSSHGPPQAQTSTDTLVFVTHIGPWKRRRHMRHGVQEFRHVRGIGFHARAGGVASPDFSSAHQVELLIAANVEAWYIEQHAWYSVHNSKSGIESRTTGHDAALVTWVLLLTGLLSSSDVAVDSERIDELWADASTSGAQVMAVTHVLQKGAVISPVCWANSSQAIQTVMQAASKSTVSPSVSQVAGLLYTHAKRLDEPMQVHHLFDFTGSASCAEHKAMAAMRLDPHTSRLINLVGVVAERRCFLRHDRSTDAWKSVCRFKLRDLRSLDSVAIAIDEEAYGTLSSLQPGMVVVISKVQCFLARASFKPFLTWTHRTTARRVSDDSSQPSLSDYQIRSAMPTTILHDLYKHDGVDRTVKRLSVHVVHTNYVVLKKRCSLCKQPISLQKRQRMWIHMSDLSSDANGLVDTAVRQCSWEMTPQDSPLLQERTYMSCSMRCVVDDGSAQAELFLENEVVWEMLQCSASQRDRFQSLLTTHTSDLTFYASKAPGDSLFTPPSAQETLYYQNEWRAFILAAMARRTGCIVIAQRFYQQAKSAPHTTLLKFGKDIQVATTSAPLVQLEAIRVDALDARQELRRRLGCM